MTTITKSEQHEGRSHHAAHIKINGTEYHTHHGENKVEHLRKLGAIHENDVLTQDRDGQRIELDEKGHVDIRGGEIFVSHKRHHHTDEVAVTINKVEHTTHTGENLIEHLKHLGTVTREEFLSEFKDDQFINLKNDGCVEIHGGEIFVSHDEGAPIVEVINLNTNLSVKFFGKWNDRLEQVWAKAYIELKETKQPDDELLCEGGTSLMGQLSLTLAQLKEQKICPNRHYEIRRRTGGA